MTRWGQRGSLLVMAALGLVGTAQSQRRIGRGVLDPPRVGPHLGYNFDADALTVGVQATLPLSARVEVYPSVDYYAINPGTLWAINLDVKLRPQTRTGALYVGGGIDYLHLHTTAGGSSGDVNLNFLGGLEDRRRPFFPYVEGRLTLGTGSTFQIVGGFNIKLR